LFINVTILTAPSQADIRLALTSSEGKKGLRSGTITWLVMGMSLEDEQYSFTLTYSLRITLMLGTVYRDSLRSDLRAASMHATTLDQTSKEDRQRKLEERLSRFHQLAGEYMGNSSEEDLDILPQFTGWDDKKENEDEPLDNEDKEFNPLNPEATAIFMPSSLKQEDILRLGLETLAAQELELRKGQASDCLQSLRMALGHKAVLYRTKMRTEKTSVGKTRNWNDAKTITTKINKYVRAYKRAHTALQRLGADSATLMQYQELRTEHLTLSADITEENRFGQRSDVLPWFWRLHGQNPDQHDTWMKECKSIFFITANTINYCLVYRVNWLRAKARYDRWNEELSIVQHEMKWTILWFKHQMEEWKNRLKRSAEERKPGHIAYAEKQVAMWKMFMREGEQGFRGMMLA
jgi:hypothetical protein